MSISIKPTSWFSFSFTFIIFSGLFLTAAARCQDWPQWQGPNRDGVWDEEGIIDTIPEAGLQPLWRTEISGGYAGPAVADGKVYVSDYVREAGDPRPSAGKRSELQGQERLSCLDSTDGKLIWRREFPCDYNFSYAAGPRATPTIQDGMVYLLGAEGDLRCLDAKSGKDVWHKDLKSAYGIELSPMWGYAAHPLVVDDTLYCLAGGEGSVVVALDKLTGEEKWKALTASEPGYCPPTMIEAGGTRQLIVWHPESLNSLNPETGEVYWSFPMEPAYKMSIVAPVHHNGFLYATALQGTSILLKLDDRTPTASEVWRGKGVHPDHNPPLLVDDHIYGVDEKGQIRCFELESGEKLWESWAAATNNRPANSTTGFIVKNGEQFFIATEQGELILARMTPQGYEERGRFKMLEATSPTSNREVVWSHPAFSNQCVFARNDKEIVCYSLKQ